MGKTLFELYDILSWEPLKLNKVRILQYDHVFDIKLLETSYTLNINFIVQVRSSSWFDMEGI
jgi:hypothetical protein